MLTAFPPQYSASHALWHPLVGRMGHFFVLFSVPPTFPFVFLSTLPPPLFIPLSLTLASSSLSFSMPTTCTGSVKDRTTCTCTLFIPRKSKATKCKSCGHRQSLHLDIPTPSHGAEAAATTTVPDNKYVSRLFKSFEATAVHESARKETLQGFRPPSPALVCITGASCYPY